MDNDNEQTTQGAQAAALLVAAVSGDSTAEVELRDLAVFDASAADLYLIALQANIGRAEALPASPTITAVADQVRSVIRDLVGGWGHGG